MELYKSPVQFFEEPHQYWLNGVRLRGITSLIGKMVYPNQYQDINPIVLQRAAQLGKRLHKNLEDNFLGKPIIAPMPELALYQSLVPNFSWMHHQIESEYLISDEISVASSIDAIYQTDENKVILADFKRTKELMPSLTWQLSCYATLFEKFNPHIQVEGLVGIHIRQEKKKSIAEVVNINRIPDEEIWKLFFSYQMGLETFESKYIV